MGDNAANDSVEGGDCKIELDAEETSGYVPLGVRRQFLNEMISEFPEPMKNRLKALKKLQLASTHLEAEFYRKVHELEFEFHLRQIELYDKRESIVNGLSEPTPEECEFKLAELSEVEEKFKDMKIFDSARSKICTNPSFEPDATGIPDFWLQIFRNVFLLNEMVQEHDEPALRHLLDVKVIYLRNPMGFVLEFHFSDNEYFSNSVLSKEYIMSCEPKKDDPFSFEGPEIVECKGCKIDWHKGKNLTMKIIRKKQKHKSRDSLRTITKQVPNDSFFNFFNPPILSEDNNDEENEEIRQLLSSDYEIAHYFRERVIPRAVLYYTGEGIEDEEEDDDEEEEEDEEDNSFGEEEDEDVKVKKPIKTENPECKQQ